MKAIEHVNNALEKIIFEGSSFNLAIRSSLKNEKRNGEHEFVSTITSICGGYLRHYYSIDSAVKKAFPDFSEKEQLLIGVALTDKLFSKKLDRDEILKPLFKERADKEKEIKDFLDRFVDPFSLIPEDMKPDSDEYLHLRYNIPLFIVKMWRRNAKGALSRKLFRTFKKNDRHVVRIDTNRISVDEFFAKYPKLTRIDDLPLAEVNDKGNVKKLPAVVEGDAINMHASYTYAFNDLDIDFVRGVAVYGGTSNDIIDELYARFGKNLKLDYLCGNQKHFFEVNNKYKTYRVKDISLYECGHDALRTCISQPVHTFIISPENTSFERLKEESDYFLRVKREDLDGLINIQYETLTNALELVEDDGYIVYMVPTLCRNETYGLIRRFISEHPNVKLEKEMQLFPFDKYNSMFYFAVLKKESSND